MTNLKPSLLFKELFQTYKIHKFILAIVVIVITASLAVPGYEQNHPKANINNFGEALWWSLVTVTAVGYGDHYPVSFGGRLVAVVLMFLGVTFTSTVVALVASYYASRKTQRDWIKVFQKLEDIEERLDKIDKKSEYLVKNGSETKTQND
ncbi:hypothetical protein COX08_02175 [Candidatus Beckwithbacteria bacterium CG23_combo_of_CG06-09_8_20_14_all_34_8]|uniref:Potassium channel domain-containing protein n=1 Tax=Candidatus Beckwithbacteria bacterium CG23_combo_of_CG06-09_8_20_14_all_34_8 TaxID=1974497 RepID=A0A2H0B841_9BACT|nr:MAG: hypothetical protein COX08_02175 [Candidatus Beckwithbacteria bacterium CG23_combo_of_CG06-09_8_20_14_all_34_8]